jgi:hypothetical protein
MNTEKLHLAELAVLRQVAEDASHLFLLKRTDRASINAPKLEDRIITRLQAWRRKSFDRCARSNPEQRDVISKCVLEHRHVGDCLFAESEGAK